MNAKQWLEAMADLEARIAKIYERFATEFRKVADVGDLWASMGREELHHAEVLSHAAGSAPAVTAAAEHVAKLEARVAQIEREVAHPVQLQDALRVTVDLEEAETEHVHGALVTLGDWAEKLAAEPTMQHRLGGVLEHAIRQFGTPALHRRMTWRRFHD
ncbi:MAG TPA: hypothetical protein VN812_09775 [Candidatus Acidoferrales bacterium]|nr:hypothetical protein [Candidatus Acidoferrales bacterium]